ncbi:TraR/DksA C4-type zinc finger protein [Paenibacillus sp. y28]|uniref:TraR/DksA C4-type zinc finger protein n=1 Tax=Paenibacillus sp. y28 TaxID=3129110 RepID=UPI0030196581
MPHLTDEQLQHLRSRLLQEKAELEHYFAQNDDFGLSESQRDAIGELSAYDNHPADVATETYERGKDIALHENAKVHLEQINQALLSMDSGTYGICRVSGKPIPYERLEALPTAAEHVDHVPDRFVSERRPVEEQFLSPPFGRTSLDEHEYNGFDGEDAWQIVESWGNSDSPAMAEDRQIESYDDMYIEAGELDGYVEPLESFLATDIYGGNITVIRNKQYQRYLDEEEGEPLLEPNRLVE